MRLIVGISGATGVIMGYRILQALQKHPECETHLIISNAAKRNFELETDYPISLIQNAADFAYDEKDMAARIASGSFLTDGMIVAPCSMKTLSAIATGYASNLLVRAADVCLKENRRVVLIPREMPLGRIHLKNLLTASELGCCIIPPMLTFYNGSTTIDDQMDHIIGKVLRQFGLEHDRFTEWKGGER